MPDRRSSRTSRPSVSRNISYLGDLIDIVNPFGKSAVRKAAANAGSALAKEHQRMNDIDDILRDHDLLTQQIHKSS